VAGSCEYGDEPSGSGDTKLVSYERLLVPVAARSKSQVLVAWVVESWVRMSMGVWMFINFVYILCCPMSVESFATG
jgi:hypothetical protein